MPLKRTHIMLDPEQKKTLEEIANQQGRSVSELAREYIYNGIDRYMQEQSEQIQKRIEVLEHAQRVRERIQKERKGVPLDVSPVDLIREMRNERDDTILDTDH